jgi:hypothetical protein
MPQYWFQIGKNGYSSEAADDAAAWHEAVAVCGDLARGVLADLKSECESEWQMDVRDNTGRTLFRFRISAETNS